MLWIATCPQLIFVTLARQVATCPYNAVFIAPLLIYVREKRKNLLTEPKYHSPKFNEADCSWVGTGRDLSAIDFNNAGKTSRDLSLQRGIQSTFVDLCKGEKHKPIIGTEISFT